jgi:hypothetical protein
METRFLICLILCCGLYNAYSQTELCIVGTSHNESSYINSDSIHNILLKVKPDIILIELDSTFFTHNFDFDLNKYPDLLSTNENIGAEKYHSQHKVDLRPFDMTGRNKYYKEINYFDNQNKMWSEVLSLYERNELSKKDKEDVELIRLVMNYNGMNFSSVKDLNVNMTVKFLSLREKIIYSKMVSIVENTEKLYHWIDFARQWEVHWYERNAIMANNIKKIVNDYKNKRIVVLVGLEHKPGLLDLLEESTDFVFREYWTY